MQCFISWTKFTYDVTMKSLVCLVVAAIVAIVTVSGQVNILENIGDAGFLVFLAS
jgi:hypothetical protein